MATAVLRPQDCLQNRHHFDAFRLYRPPPAKPSRNKTPQPPLSSTHSLRSPSPSAELCRRLPPLSPRSPPPPKAGSVSGARQPRAARQRRPPLRTDGTVSEGDGRSGRVLEMGQVRILKRGEELKRAASVTTPDLVSVGFSPKRLDTEPLISPPKMLGLQRPKAYAGPAYIVSPSPDSLPLPSPLLIHRIPTTLRHA